jgi:hypothetical protein
MTILEPKEWFAETYKLIHSTDVTLAEAARPPSLKHTHEMIIMWDGVLHDQVAKHRPSGPGFSPRIPKGKR